MQDSLTRLREAWLNTSRTNQVMLVTAVVVALVVGVGFLFWAGSPDYVTLVSNPSPADSSRIVELLKTRKVAYRISPDGGTIEVPAIDRPELRMSLAGAGLLNTGSLGYELLDKAPFGQTQAMEQETIRRALEGEMEKSIQSLDPVASANVKIAPGEDSPFVNPDKKEPSASILVHLKPGSELNKANVRAVVSLVKSAYTGLNEKNITLVDGEGNLLWDGAQQTADTVGSDERQAQERIFKENLAREVQSQIQAAVGAGKSSVIVRAVLNLDKQSQTTHDITPGQRASRSTEEETLKGGGSIAPTRPPAGVAANTGGANPPTYGGGVDVGSGNYSHTITSETMATGTSETHTVKAPGEVKFLAVSVLLDKSVPADTAEALRQSIQTYIGQDAQDPASRQVTVQQVAFDKSGEKEEAKRAEAAASREQMSRWIGWGVPLVIMAAMLFILWRALKPKATPGRLVIGPGGQPMLAGAEGGLDMLVGDGGPAGVTVGQALSGTGDPKTMPVSEDGVHVFEAISEAFDANLESISHLAKSKPEMVARLVKSWVAEDR